MSQAAAMWSVRSSEAEFGCLVLDVQSVEMPPSTGMTLPVV
jgi:hypothetical protein